MCAKRSQIAVKLKILNEKKQKKSNTTHKKM